MTKWELIICFTSRTWDTVFVEHPNHIEEEDVHQTYLQDYIRKNEKKGIKRFSDIAYIGTFNTESIDDE